MFTPLLFLVSSLIISIVLGVKESKPEIQNSVSSTKLDLAIFDANKLTKSSVSIYFPLISSSYFSYILYISLSFLFSKLSSSSVSMMLSRADKSVLYCLSSEIKLFVISIKE